MVRGRAIPIGRKWGRLDKHRGFLRSPIRQKFGHAAKRIGGRRLRSNLPCRLQAEHQQGARKTGPRVPRRPPGRPWPKPQRRAPKEPCTTPFPGDEMAKLPPVSRAAPGPEPKNAPDMGPTTPDGIAPGPPGEAPVMAVPE